MWGPDHKDTKATKGDLNETADFLQQLWFRLVRFPAPTKTIHEITRNYGDKTIALVCFVDRFDFVSSSLCGERLIRRPIAP